MRVREATNSLRRLRAGLLALLAAGPLALAACGEDDFPNEPRPAIPIELTAAIDDRSVTISPREFGAGLVVITISNQTDEPLRLVLEGPTTEASNELSPGGTGEIKASLQEGEYEASTGATAGIKPTTLEVGAPRPTGQNELLQP